MKKEFFLVLVAGLFFSLTACAQPQGPRGNFSPEDMAKRQTEMIQKATGIDDATAKKVQEINLKYSKIIRDMREKSDDREAMREEMGKIREKRDAEIKALLTDEQYKKYQAQQEEMRKNRQGGGGPR